MRFAPEISEEEYRSHLRAEVVATYGEVRAQEDEAQLGSAARALRLIAQVEVPSTGEDPFFLGIVRDD